MKKILVLVLLFSTLTNSNAQDVYHTGLLTQFQSNYGLSGGLWVLPNTETATFANAFTYGTTASTITPSGQSFTQARSFNITANGDPWNSGHFCRNTAPISSNDKCLLVIWLRSSTPDAQVNILAENSTTYNKECFATVLVQNQWQQFLIPFQATAAYASNTLNVGLHLGWANQVVEVGGAAVINYKNNYNLSQLPVNLHNDYYAGVEPNAPWRAAAAASIEQLRKADLHITVKDPQGNPIPNASVYIEMKQHAFGFGTAVISNRFGGGNEQDDTYEQKMLNLDGNGHGFNEVVFENDLKWPAWEQHWYSSQPEIADAVAWLQERNIKIRGHNLVWPGWGYSPSDLEPNKGNPTYLKNRIRNHLNSILGYPGIGTACTDWDVLNEITQNTDYADALAGKPGYITGRELYPEIFKRADSLAPNSNLYLNDYVAIERGQYDTGVTDIWKTRIDELLAAGAPLEGIGFQGHFGAFPTGIPRVKSILDDFWNTYGLEAKITEYDIDKLVPTQTQAAYMRDILTISFAHPSMKGFLMWGFWDGAHWLGNAPIFNQNWSLKPSGEAFVDQVFHKWWTNESALTDANGVVTVRGFKGKYVVRVACANSIQEQEVTLDDNQSLSFAIQCLTRVREPQNEPVFWVTPNLTNDQIQMRWDAVAAPSSVQAFNMAGQLMAQMANFTGSESVFNVRNWPSGIYIVNADFEGTRVQKKVVILR
jgi:endo-1,4-beta-xylanase